MIIISIDKYNVAVIEHDSPYAQGHALEYLYSRSDFAGRFGIQIPAEVTSVTYEPDRNMLFVVRGNDIQGFNSPAEDPILNAIYENTPEILRITQGLYLGSDYEWNAEDEVYYLPASKILERKWAQVRSQRTALLQRTDYLMLPDVRRSLTELQVSEIEAYRQSLRAIPQTFQNPDDVVYPEKPVWVN